MAGMLARLAASLTVLGLIAWQAPIMIPIVLFIALVAVQGALLVKAYRNLKRHTGASFRRATRRLAFEVAAGIAANAAVFFGSMWVASIYG